MANLDFITGMLQHLADLTTLLKKQTPRDQTIKLFRPSGARNPPKSLALFKRIVLRAQEELEAPTG